MRTQLGVNRSRTNHRDPDVVDFAVLPRPSSSVRSIPTWKPRRRRRWVEHFFRLGRRCSRCVHCALESSSGRSCECSNRRLADSYSDTSPRSLGGIWCSGLEKLPIPALFTRMSARPKSRSTSAATDSTERKSVTSHSATFACPARLDDDCRRAFKGRASASTKHG